jgi:rhamnosyltransferase
LPFRKAFTFCGFGIRKVRGKLSNAWLNKKMKISAVIPTFNAGGTIESLLQILQRQTISINEIIVIDSQSSDNTETICRRYNRLVFYTVAQQLFDHGTTRDNAFRKTSGDFVLFFTQDAIPTDEYYVENILQFFHDENIAMVSGRQIAKPEASFPEQLIRRFNYPPHSYCRSENDIPELGIKTFFASNVCSAYRRSAYLQIGGFTPTPTNEDMLIAARFILSGYKTAYCAKAQVFHSHNFNLKKQFQRNYQIGVFFRTNASVFQNISNTSEGLKLIKYVVPQLWKQRHYLSVLSFCFECGVKWLAYQCGYNSFNPSRAKRF